MNNTDLAGNIQHNVNPVVGWLRLAIHNGDTLTAGQMESAVEKLMEALDNAKQIG